MDILQRTKSPVRVWRLCKGRGCWPKAAALFWCQDVYRVLSQFLRVSKLGKGVDLRSKPLTYFYNHARSMIAAAF